MHTPRDHGWHGDELTSDDQEVLRALRSSWANDLVTHCLRAEPPVTAIAVTDHHDFCIAEQVLAAAAGTGLIVFPGVEVTCSDNAQCLVLLDPHAPLGLIQKLVASLPGVPPYSASDSRGPRLQHADVTVQELADLLDTEIFRGKCLLLPHFGDGGAHKTLNVPSNGARFAALHTEGVYIEMPFSDLQSGTIDKIRGNTAEWGNRRRGVIATGDNKSGTFERVGRHPCWLKLGEATVEGLRQALLADEARISYAVPDEASERIVEMEVQSKLTGDAPLVVSFNAGFTALVGGRGTGKSALLEYLRFGLGRTETDIPKTEVGYETSSRESELIEDTLTNGYVKLTLAREGVQEVWRRDLATRDYIESLDASGNSTKLTLDAARERFRARAFRQKGLSSLTSNQANTADQVTGIAAAEQLAKRREIDRAITNAKRSVGTTLQQVVSHWQANLEQAQARDRAADLSERLRSVNSILGQGGVSGEHLTTIEMAGTHARANAYLDLVADMVSAERQALPEESYLAASLPGSLRAEDFPHLAKLSERVSEVRQQITAAYDAARNALDRLLADQQAAKGTQLSKDQALGLKMLEAQEAQQAHHALIEDSKRLGNELAEAEQLLGRATGRAQETQPYEVSFRKAQRELLELLLERRKVLGEAAEQVAGKSSGLLKARLGRDKAPTQFIAALLRLTEGSYITDAETKCSDWVKVIATEETAWERVAADLTALYQAKISAGSPSEPGGEIVATIRNLFFPNSPVTERQAIRIYNNLNDSTLADVLSAIPQDQIVMTYVDESGKEMAFGMASPGQQASALLELLLRQSAGTLLIDQPEDDLDNRVIMKIVGLIRSSKANRQVIFTTHNPNIVVNGDADKVIALRTREAHQGGRYEGAIVSLQVDGAIETSEVRDYITNLIEGGKEAFDLRGRKYGYEGGRAQK